VHDARKLEEIDVFWLSGMSCDGCSVALTGAQNPALEELMQGAIPNLPAVRLHHPMFSLSCGEDFTAPFRSAMQGELPNPYLVVLEGSVPDDQALAAGRGYYAAFGSATFGHPDSQQPDRMTDWLKRLAPGAAACIAIGTCATWGGIPAAAGNITGSMSLMDFLGPSYRSTAGLPVVNVPGCAPVGDNFTETLTALLMYLQGLTAEPQFDDLGRPQWLFGQTAFRHCPKAGYYEEGVFAKQYGDNECLVEVGCWGPVVLCNIVERGAINHMGGCMVAGGPCIGCTMPGFPDRFAPFLKPAPGTVFSGGISKGYGGMVRRLRRMSMRSGNREPLWDNADAVPSPWARARFARTPTDRVMGYFYKRLQYRGSVNLGDRNKKQPLPKSLDILRQEGVDLTESVPVLREPIKSREEL
jgi:hydrogenase small subunit